MASRGSPSPSPSSPSRRRRGFARKCERCCWTSVTHMPLAFVYGLTTWAVYVEGTLSLLWLKTSWRGYPSLTLGLTLYILLNWSYSTAVFTDPGSPSSSPSSPTRRPKNGSTHQYSHLPTYEPSTTSSVRTDLSSFTVKSTGAARFCKKCQTHKPDRAHHCSTCRRCVLKMDHHCPWLATCVGLRNYKPFLLFLTYTTLFSWVCFVVSSLTLWTEIVSDARFEEGFLPVNMVLLAVLSGIMGLVLTGFTGWHIGLAVRNQTTIECLEKTRYLSPIRRGMQRVQMGAGRSEEGSVVKRYGQQLAEIHANVIPGATRYEEGEERPSPAADLEQGMTAREALRMNYDDMERERERQRYEDYLDEQDSEKLPNAFDLGWKRNLFHLMGEQPLLWFLPVCNTVGDGWHWDPSTKWLEARESTRLQREVQWHAQERSAEQSRQRSLERNFAANTGNDAGRHYLTTSNGAIKTGRSAVKCPSKADKILGRTSNEYADGSFDSGMSMKTLRRKESFDGRTDDGEDQYEVSSDEAECGREETSPRDGDRRGRPTGSTDRDSADDEWREWE